MNLMNQFKLWRLLVAQTSEAVPAPAANGATPDGGAGGGGGVFGGGFGGMLPMIIAFIAIMYFFLIRPQQKRDKERRDMLGALSKGDSVVTTGGICGSVVGLSENNVVLRVDDNVTMEFVRSAIAQITERDGESKKK